MSASALIRPDSAVFPMLAEMGVRRFHEISHYTLRQDGPRDDILRIHYKRRKGSFLPVTRRYAFGRSIRTVVADGGTARLEETFEISPYLLDAIAELDRLVATGRPASIDGRHGAADPKSDLLDDLDTLRARFAPGLSEEDAADFTAAIADLGRRIDAL